MATTASTAAGNSDPGPSDEQTIHNLDSEVPVTEVTLLEDRALVTRRATLELPAGRSQLRIPGVAPVLVDKTLDVRLVGDSRERAQVLGASLERRRITADSQRPAALASLREQLRDHQSALTELRQREARLSTQLASLDKLSERSLTELAEDVGWGAPQLADADAQLEALETRQHELARARARVAHEIERSEHELHDLQQLIHATAKLDSSASAAVTIELSCATATSVELRIDYLVPGALWRPWHRAQLIEDEAGARVEFRCEAAVWQATGEDWRDVELVFSTARPSLGVTPPKLASDALALQASSSVVEVEARDQTVHDVGLGGEDIGEDGGPARDGAGELPGIDDGGEALELRSHARASIPGDGRPHRVPIFSFSDQAEVQLVCAAELEAAVLTRSRQLNKARHPLLAGPVDLLRRGGLVGRSSILFVAPSERFELGWGPDSALRVQREVEQLDIERRALSSWSRRPQRVRVRLSNLSAEPRSIEVRERIAVSEVDKVEVEVREASRGAKPDAQGFVTWDLRLRGFGHECLELTWVLVVHDNVSGL